MVVDRTRLPPLGSDPPFTFPRASKQSLANGLRVWTVEHHDVPVLCLLLLVPAGSASDPASRPGLASLTGALLDEGSGERSVLEIHDALGRIGAQFGVDVGTDATILRMTTLSRFAGRALALLADMAIHPRFEPDEFARVRDLRLDRLVQLRDLAPAVANRTFAQAIYGSHPYGHLPIGTEAALRALTRDEVVAFHHQVYRPSEATLIAVGSAPHDELLNAAAQAFEGWTADKTSESLPAANADNAAPVSTPPGSGARLIVVNRPHAAQSELRIGHVGTSRSTPDYHALLVLNMVLGGQFSSRINLNLREDKGYTYGARTAFEFRRDRGPFVAHLSVQTNATSASIREMLNEIRAIREDRPVTEEELGFAKAGLTRGYPRSFETADQIARALAQIALHQLPDDYFTQFVPCVESVERATATHAARSHLDPDRLTTVIVGDRDAVEASLAELNLGIPEEVEIA